MVLLLLLAADGPGCKKFVEVSPPDTQLQTGLIFSSDQTATAAMMGVYSRAMATSGYFLNGGNSLYPGLSSDEFAGTAAAASVDAFAGNSLSSANYFISLLYSSAYNTIYDANAMIEDLQASKGITVTTKRQLRGEALCLRALTYFHLVDLYGPVPLETSTNYAVNAVAPRFAVTAVYGQIVTDLQAADSLLDTAYAVNPADPEARTRPNKWAARSLLARAYLYRGQWAAAEDAATAVLGVSDYRLEPSLDSVFRAGSREAIWQLQPVSATTNSAEGYFFVPASGALMKPAYALTNFLLNAFEPGDRRRLHWVGSKTVSGVTYTYPFKYKVRTGLYPYTEYDMVLRLAEQFLIRAEARAQQNNRSGALADLDMVRARAGLAVLPAGLSVAQVLVAVAQERRIELFAEWGHRWSDLRRTGQADAVLGVEKPGWQHNAALYPIPLTDIERNPAIVQNPGY
jgi:hypothetical protein